MSGNNSNAEIKTALVTGGSRGIGLGIVKHLLKENWKVAVCGRKTPEEASDFIKQYPDVIYTACDMAVKEQRHKLLEELKLKLPYINLLVNNAGMAPRIRADILEASEESFDEIINVNLKGPYFLTQSMAKWMIESQNKIKNFNGSIVNISSISATVASVSRGDYCISKAGISMSTQLWATRLAQHGIPVFELRPGIIKTDMTAAVTEKYDKLIAEGLLLMPRWGTPEDVGKAVAMLAKGGLPYATGQAIYLDGGLTVNRL